MNNYRRAKLLSAQTKMVRQMMGLQWWKSTAKWEAEQEMEDCTDLSTLQPPLTLSGCTDTQVHNGMQHRKEQAHRHGQRAEKLHPTTRSRTTSRKQYVTQHLPQKRFSHSQSSSSSSSSQSNASSSDSSDRKLRKSASRDEQARVKKKKQFGAIYANRIQETSKECKKELQRYKVTNLVNGQRSRQFGRRAT